MKTWIKGRCKCVEWARDGSSALLTEHHPACPDRNVEAEVKAVLEALIIGIESWAADEDGVHPDCWDAYCNARAMIGNPAPEVR